MMMSGASAPTVLPRSVPPLAILSESRDDEEGGSALTVVRTRASNYSPFTATSIYLAIQFNVALYLSQQSHPKGAYFLVNVAVVTFGIAAYYYRIQVLANLQVTTAMARLFPEEVTFATLLLLLLQRPDTAFLVLIAGLLYMTLASVITNVYLLTIESSGDLDSTTARASLVFETGWVQPRPHTQ